MKFEEALDLRLSTMKPSKTDMIRFMEQRPPTLSPGIAELVEILESRVVDIYLVSGGFREIIRPVAEKLQIPTSNIFANTIFFHVFFPCFLIKRSHRRMEVMPDLIQTNGHQRVEENLPLFVNLGLSSDFAVFLYCSS